MKKLVCVISLISVLGSASIFPFISEIEVSIANCKIEFFTEEDGFTIDEKNKIWSEAWKIAEEHMSNLEFGGNKY